MRPPSSIARGGRGRQVSGGRGLGRGNNRGGGRGGATRDEGPPAEVVEVGMVMHECESELVCKLIEKDSRVPYFNAGIFLENKRKIGKVDEIFGPINSIMFTVKPDPGIFSKNFEKNDVLYIGTDKLLPLSRFTNPGKPTASINGRGGGRGGGRGRISGRGPAVGRSGSFSPSRGGGRGNTGRNFNFSGRGARFGGRGRQ